MFHNTKSINKKSFLYSLVNKLKMKLRKQFHLQSHQKNKIGIDLRKEMKDLYPENYKKIFKEIKIYIEKGFLLVNMKIQDYITLQINLYTST